MKESKTKLIFVLNAYVSCLADLPVCISSCPMDVHTLSIYTCSGDAGWSSWTPGVCGGPCGQNGTAVATRKCNGPSQCCCGKRTRTGNCTSAPC